MMRRAFLPAVIVLVLAMLYVSGLYLFNEWRPWLDDTSPRVVDDTELLSGSERRRITEFHELLQQDYGIDYRVLVVSRVGNLDRYAADRFGALSVGDRTAGGRGLLLVLDQGRDEVRLEVSRALEGVFTDAFVAYIEQRQMVPFFAANRVSDGILATTEMIVDRAREARAQQAFDDEPGKAVSLGAGARAPARLGEGAEAKSTARMPSIPSLDTPPAAILAYVEAMDARNSNPELPFYSEASRKLMRDWVVTPAQMDNAVRSYRQCSTEPLELIVQDDRAVMRYPPSARRCHPWFAVFEDEAWRLDLVAMQRLVRFGRGNAWHFPPQQRGEGYAFGFKDWTFDGHGYPRQQPAR
jgi:uncharacterized protein